jgi:hypothetical protein
MPGIAGSDVHTGVSSAQPERRGKKKQAVVVIHGMGEQRPMSTLRGFVDAVWTQNHYLPELFKDKGIIDPARPNRSWITPDSKTGSYEQRRITTPYDRNGRRTDFFEIYWADVTQGTTRGRLYAWMKTLLWRRKADIPADAVKLYWATVVFAILLALAAGALTFTFWKESLAASTVAVAVVLASLLFWALDQFVVPYFGDVASYVRAEAGTVEKRAQVRERGLALLRKLADDPSYDRIVLVGHSLGTIIAYDLLQILWAESRPWNIDPGKDASILKAVDAVQAHARLPSEAFPTWDQKGLREFREAQWGLYRALRGVESRLGRGWKVSDFVTLGSPLTHAEFLVTHNMDEWRQGVIERQFAICPPLSDDEDKRTILFKQGRDRLGTELFAAHHAALFAATRWTNICDIGNLLTTGDPISGHMWENFGPGVDTVQVALRWHFLGAKRRIFTHTKYWDVDAEGLVMAPIRPVGSGTTRQSGGGPLPGDPDTQSALKPVRDMDGSELQRAAFSSSAIAAVKESAEAGRGQEHLAALRVAVDLGRRLGDDETPDATIER